MNGLLLSFFVFSSLIFAMLELITGKSSKLFFWVFTLIFALLCSTRSELVQDTTPYIEAFNNVSTSFIYKTTELAPFRFELGYTALMQITKIIFGNNYKVFFFIVVIINYGLIYAAYNRLSKRFGFRRMYYIVLFSLYTSYYGIYYNAIVLRAGLAISLLIYTSTFLIERRYVISLILFWISTKFHDSAILGILPFSVLILKFELSKKKYRLILLLLFVFHMLQINQYILPHLVSEITNITSSFKALTVFRTHLLFYSITEGRSLKLIFYILIGLLVTFLKLNDDEIILKKYVNVYFLGLILATLFSGLDAFSRISDFCLVFNILILLFFLTKKKVKNDILIPTTGAIIIGNYILIVRVINLYF